MVSSLASFQTNLPFIPISEGKKDFLKNITRVVLEILFPLVTALLLASLMPAFPIYFNAFVLTSSTCGTILMAAGLFSHENVSIKKREDMLPPLISKTNFTSNYREIKNEACNCWLNATLQLLRASSSFKEVINKGIFPENRPNLKEFFENYEKGKELNSQKVREEIAQKPSSLSASSSRQEDAHNGLITLLEPFKEMEVQLSEISTYDTSDSPHLSESDDDEKKGVTVYPPNRRGREEKTCPVLSLEFQKSLREMLKGYFREDQRGEGPVIRSQGKDNSEHEYQRERVDRGFKTPPKSLFLHVKRFEYDLEKGVRVKREDSIEVSKTIKIPLMEDSLQSGEASYRLKGILVHTGETAKSGHYVSYVLDDFERGWFCNDSRISRQDLASWPLQEAYLLLYEKIDSLPPN